MVCSKSADKRWADIIIRSSITGQQIFMNETIFFYHNSTIVSSPSSFFLSFIKLWATHDSGVSFWRSLTISYQFHEHSLILDSSYCLNYSHTLTCHDVISIIVILIISVHTDTLTYTNEYKSFELQICNRRKRNQIYSRSFRTLTIKQKTAITTVK